MISGIDCVDAGDGPTVIFLPGSYSTAAAWRPVQRHLGPGWRALTTSLCGFGGTRDTRTVLDWDIAHEVRVVEALAARAPQPVHLVGHSYGGTVALAAAVAGSVEVASLALFEANPMSMIFDEAHHSLYQQTVRMSLGFEQAVAAGEPDAPRRIIDFWGGEGAFARMPEAVRAYCVQTATVNVLDWRSDCGFHLTPADCSSLDLPVLLVRGSDANAAMVAMTDALHASLPDSSCHTMQGAGHFLINSHPAQCADLLASFLHSQPH